MTAGEGAAATRGAGSARGESATTAEMAAAASAAAIASLAWRADGEAGAAGAGESTGGGDRTGDRVGDPRRGLTETRARMLPLAAKTFVETRSKPGRGLVGLPEERRGGARSKTCVWAPTPRHGGRAGGARDGDVREGDAAARDGEVDEIALPREGEDGIDRSRRTTTEETSPFTPVHALLSHHSNGACVGARRVVNSPFSPSVRHGTLVSWTSPSRRTSALRRPLCVLGLRHKKMGVRQPTRMVQLRVLPQPLLHRLPPLTSFALAPTASPAPLAGR